jgi:nicotinamidase-related amidase
MRVLVVIDMQNDFITGSLGTPEARAIVPHVKKKIKDAVKNGDMIIYTRDTHPDEYLLTKEGETLPVEHCIHGTEGWRIPSELLPPGEYENMMIIDKPTFGSYELVEKLIDICQNTGCNEIEICGLCTDICVVSNALLIKAAFYETHDISVDANCCAGVTPESHEAALKTMEMCQINVKR